MGWMRRWGAVAGIVATLTLGSVACSDDEPSDGSPPPEAPGAPAGPDAGTPDAGTPDAGRPDGGGRPDAGPADGGRPDAGPGTDGGSPSSTAFEKVFEAPGQDEGASIAFGNDGHLLVASTHFVSLPDFGAGRQPESGTAALSRFSADGTHLWTYAETDTRTCGGGEPCITSGLNARAAAADTEGRSAIATLFYEEGAAFGEYLLRQTPRITALDASGRAMWTQRIEGPAGNADVSDLGFDAAGNLYAWGFVQGPGWNLGDGQPRGVPFQETSFLVSYDPAGNVRFVKAFGDARGVSRSHAMAVEPDGSIVLAGAMAGRLSFGGEELVGNEDGRVPSRENPVAPRLFVVRYGPNIQHRWSRLVTGTEVVVTDVAANGQGIALAGRFDETLTFAGRTLTASFTEAGPTDGFAALMALDGSERWATSLRSTFDDHFFGVGLTPAGDVWAAGAVFGSASVGQTPVPGEGGEGPRLALAQLRGADGATTSVASPRAGVIGRGDLAVDPRGVLALTSAVVGGAAGCERGCGEPLELYLLQRLP